MNLKSSSLVWKDLCISPFELRLNTLKCGQSFRWKQMNDYWASALHGRLVVLKETPSSVFYGYDKELSQEAIVDIKNYFQLDKVSLKDCYARWSKVDPNFAKKSVGFQGIRMLRQDPWENLISFICSSNNNISRISLMINKFCEKFSHPLAVLDDQIYYDFPSMDDVLSKYTIPDIEKILRELGFGYRAKYIAKTMESIQSEPLGQAYLTTLRDKPYVEAKEALMKFQGVGPKVADCVCLMSLDHSESIPVDTHVWQIALRDYGFKSKGIKTLNAKLYLQVGDHFRVLFGEYSGWAHSVLFTADLKNFETSKKRKQEEEQVADSVKKEKLHV